MTAPAFQGRQSIRRVDGEVGYGPLGPVLPLLGEELDGLGLGSLGGVLRPAGEVLDLFLNFSPTVVDPWTFALKIKVQS